MIPLKVPIAAFVIILVVVPFALVSASYSNTIANSGSVFYGVFPTKGTNVAINIFHPDSLNYQPEAWTMLKDLGVNVVRAWAGVEGDLHHLSIVEHPNEWARNLDNFLNEAHINNIRVVFSQLSNRWDTLFGIVCPEPYKGIVGTPIDQAKNLLDKLGGSNTLNHNFLADDRVFAWSVANEVDLGNTVTREWCIQVLDYVRSKGGKAYISCPYDSRARKDWLGNLDFHITEPILRGHVDYLQIHIYRVQFAWDVQQSNQDVYTVLYNEFKRVIQQYMIDGRGAMPLDKLIVGEFGIWHGYDDGSDIGGPANFTEKTRGEYYRAMYQATKDLGIKHVFNYYCFGQKEVDGTYARRYEVIDIDGTYFTDCTAIMQKYYKLS